MAPPPNRHSRCTRTVLQRFKRRDTGRSPSVRFALRARGHLSRKRGGKNSSAIWHVPLVTRPSGRLHFLARLRGLSHLEKHTPSWPTGRSEAEACRPPITSKPGVDGWPGCASLRSAPPGHDGPLVLSALQGDDVKCKFLRLRGRWRCALRASPEGQLRTQSRQGNTPPAIMRASTSGSW
jgi:hypothetical protein